MSPCPGEHAGRRARQGGWRLALALWLLLAATLQAGTKAPPADPLLARLTAAATQLQQAAGTGQVATLQQAVDLDALATAVARDYPAATAANTALRAQLAATFDWGAAVCQAVRDGGTYRLVQVRQVDGQWRALFRLTTPSGLNYHDLALQVTGDEVRVVDIYLYAEGEWVTATWRRQYLGALARRPAAEGLMLHAADATLVAQLPHLAQLQQQIRAGQNADALATWATLPATLQATKYVQVARLYAALRLPAMAGDAAAAALATFAHDFPGDPAADFIQLAAAREQQQWDAALAALDRLAPVVAGDPFLDVTRGTIAFQRGQLAAARALGEQAVRVLPDLPEPHLLLIAVCLAQQDDAALARQLTAAQKQVGMQFRELDQQPAFAHFVTSAAYRQWLSLQPKAK